MILTQISLTEKEYLAAKREAERLGISLAELLRRSLRAVIPADEAKSWMRYAGMVESGDPRSSQNIDDVVYGRKYCGLGLYLGVNGLRRPIGYASRALSPVVLGTAWDLHDDPGDRRGTCMVSATL